MHSSTKGKINKVDVPCDVKETKQSKEQHKRKHDRRKNTKFICIVLAVKITVSFFKFKFLSYSDLEIFIWNTA